MTTRMRTVGSRPLSTLGTGGADLFDELTGDDSAVHALAAAVQITRVRRASGRGPTFRELFEVVVAEMDGDVWLSVWRELDGPDRQAIRYHTAIHWRRLGWISWTRLERSLKPGPVFRDASRRRRATEDAGAVTGLPAR